MIIRCPSCAVKFLVPDDKMSKPRVVVCGRCGFKWREIGGVSRAESATAFAPAPPPSYVPEEPSLDIPQDEMPPIPQGLRVDADMGQPRARHDSHILMGGGHEAHSPLWLPVAIGVLLAAVVGLLLLRNTAFANAPPLAGLYHLAGVPTASRLQGLSLKDVKIQREGKGVLIQGMIVNGGQDARPVPSLQIEWRDAGGQSLRQEDRAVTQDAKDMPAGAQMPFRFALTSEDTRVASVALSLVAH